MIAKSFESPEQAVADIGDGASVMIGGFGTAGMPDDLIDVLIARVPLTDGRAVVQLEASE